MTDAELLEASIPAACDLLEERGLGALVPLLRDAPGLLEAAVALLEEEVRTHFYPGVHSPTDHYWGDRLALIAAHRGESPESAEARLAPIRPSYGARDWPGTESSRSYATDVRRLREVEDRVYARPFDSTPGLPLIDVLADLRASLDLIAPPGEPVQFPAPPTEAQSRRHFADRLAALDPPEGRPLVDVLADDPDLHRQVTAAALARPDEGIILDHADAEGVRRRYAGVRFADRFVAGDRVVVSRGRGVVLGTVLGTDPDDRVRVTLDDTGSTVSVARHSVRSSGLPEVTTRTIGVQLDGPAPEPGTLMTRNPDGTYSAYVRPNPPSPP